MSYNLKPEQLLDASRARRASVPNAGASPKFFIRPD